MVKAKINFFIAILFKSEESIITTKLFSYYLCSKPNSITGNDEKFVEMIKEC